jgi:NAD(P)-dependent dehydrogenase (short-subunit alcohol dehydrogenase family)
LAFRAADPGPPSRESTRARLQPTFLDDVDRALGGGVDPDTGYVLAKRGVMRLCERLSLDWGRRGGRLVSMSPGLIDTPMGRQELAHQEMTGGAL